VIFLDRFLAYPLETLPYIAFALIIGFSVHEFSHAYVAYLFGDYTAQREGRLTLNPISHIEPFGMLMILIAGFGWAKPVPVNRFLLRGNKKLSSLLISFAGPFSNFLIAVLFLLINFLLLYFNLFDRLTANAGEIIANLFEYTIFLNLVLFIFNLLPFPPLDGYRIIEDLAPQNLRMRLIEYEKYGVFIFLILLITPLGDYIFTPIFNYLLPLILNYLTFIFKLIFNI